VGEKVENEKKARKGRMNVKGKETVSPTSESAFVGVRQWTVAEG